MMIFLSLRVTADAGGGLKGPAHLHRSLRGLGGGSHQQASAGIYRRIACHNSKGPKSTEDICTMQRSYLNCNGRENGITVSCLPLLGSLSFH